MGLFDRLRDDAPRVAFVGIDGVPYTLLADHPEEFPNVAALIDDGAAGSIDSIVPPESSACWPALTSGKNPGRTGVYGFQDREPGSYETYIPTEGDVQTERLWDVVHDAGRSATVMNVLCTFPPQRTIQRMVSGMLAPGLENAAVPDDFRETLESIGYRIDVDAGVGHEDKAAFVDDAHATLDARFRAFEHYLREDDWDLFFGVFMAPDRINHFLFRDYERGGEYEAEFFEFYRSLDAKLGRLREAIADDVTLILASDHGFTSLKYEMRVNEWLAREGWLSYRSDDHGALTDIAEESTAYSLPPGRLYLNLEGRDPRGSVSQAEYETVRDELAERLRELTGPDGSPVVDTVQYREEIYAGDHVDLAPDLAVLPAHGFKLNAGFEAYDPVFEPAGARNGEHSFENATLIVDDPDVTIRDDTDLLDLAPTILDLMDLEYDSGEYDGASLARGHYRDRTG